jgi:hypothetical protein
MKTGSHRIPIADCKFGVASSPQSLGLPEMPYFARGAIR